MLPANPYSIKNWHSLDDIMKDKARCEFIVKMDSEHPNSHYSGYARTAEKWIPLFEAEIEKRRTQGQETIREKLTPIMGADVIILEPQCLRKQFTRGW